MITVVTDKTEVIKLLNRFHRQLDNFMFESIHCWVGYPSGSFEDTVQYSPKLNIWKSHIEFNQEQKYWNGFDGRSYVS